MKHNILMVDDETEIIELYTEYLKINGEFEINPASNGVEALEVFEKSTFDLLITDIDMPKMSGIELIEKLAHTRNSLKGIIVMTGKQKERMREVLALSGLKLPPLIFLEKPFSPRRLLEEAQSFF